jgi:hypothetical protein
MFGLSRVFRMDEMIQDMEAVSVLNSEVITQPCVYRECLSMLVGEPGQTRDAGDNI